MLCFLCIVAWQSHEIERDQIGAAVTVYDGYAICMTHVNKSRGWPADPNWRHEEEPNATG